MKKQFLLLCMITASVFTTFADKTIYVANAQLGTKDGSSAANACELNQIFGVKTPAVALDATGTTTVYFDASAEYSINADYSSAKDRACVLIPDNLTRRVIFEGNNAILKGTSTSLRMFRIGSLTNVELKNLTIKNGTHPAALGGAIFFAGDSLKISGCVFDHNSSDNGGAIGSRGKYLKITNSWFKDNYLLNSFQGGAISHTGTTAGGALIVENTTFSNNLGKAASNAWGTAIITAFDGTTRNYLNTISISNCTFYKNNAGFNTNAGNTAIQLDYLNTTLTGTVTTATFVNNTFYGNSNCGIRVWGKQQAVSLINNVIVGDSWANVSGAAVQDHGIIYEFSVADGRPALVAKNNYIVTKVPKSTKNDDVALASGNTDGNTLVTTTAQTDIDALGLSPDLQTSGSVVPYLGIAASSSPLVEGGISIFSGITIPVSDTRGVSRGTETRGTKYDIGSYEFDNFTTEVSTVSEDFFTLRQSAGEITIDNQGGSALSVNMYSTNGQNIYSINVTKSLTIRKNQLPKGVLILAVNNGLKTVAKKIVL